MSNYKISYSVISKPTTLGNWWFTGSVFKLTSNSPVSFFMEDAGNINDPRAVVDQYPLKIFTSNDGVSYTESTTVMFPSAPKMYFELGAITDTDVNFDGVNDILVRDESERGTGPNFIGAQQFILLSQPDKTFKQISLPSTPVTTHAMSVADLNKDGKYEILVTNIGYDNPNSILWTVDKNGIVTTDYKISPEVVRGASVKENEVSSGLKKDLYFYSGISDLNGDGWDDIAFISPWNTSAFLNSKGSYLPDISNRSVIYWNDGKGGFDLNNRTNIPVEKYLPHNGKNYYLVAQGVNFSDLNGDGYKDMFITYMKLNDVNSADPSDWQCYGVLINDGKGGFSDQTNSWFKDDPYHFSDISGIYGTNESRIQMGDFNNSGMQSVFARTSYFDRNNEFQVKNVVYLNTGRNFFPVEISEMNPSFYKPYETNWSPMSLTLTSSSIVDPFEKNLTAYSMNKVNGDVDKGVIYKTVVENLPTRFNVGATKVATDKFGSAGKTLEILGAAFGKDSVNNKSYVGAGLQLFDNGLSMQQVSDILISNKFLPSSSESLVKTLWTNVMNQEIDRANLDYYKELLDSKTLSNSQLITLAAETNINKSNVGLIGVWSGVEYI